MSNDKRWFRIAVLLCAIVQEGAQAGSVISSELLSAAVGPAGIGAASGAGASRNANGQQLTTQQINSLQEAANTIGGTLNAFGNAKPTASAPEGGLKPNGPPGTQAPKINSEAVAQNLPKIERAPSAQQSLSHSMQLRSALQQVQAKPLDAQARANLQSSMQRQAIANRMLVRDAASGDFDTSGYRKISAAMAAAVTIPDSAPEVGRVPNPQQKGTIAAAAIETKEVPASSARGADATSWAKVNQVETGAQATRAPASEAQTRFDDAATAANYVVERMKSELAPVQIASTSDADEKGGASSSFTQALLTAAVGPAAAKELDVAASGLGQTGATDDAAPKTPTGVGVASRAEQEAEVPARPLTADEKKLLGAIVEASVGVGVDAAESIPPEMIAGDPEAALLGAMKKASEDEPAYRKMLGDLNSIVETKILHNVGLRSAFAARAEKALVAIDATPSAESDRPVQGEDEGEDSYAPLRRACAGLLSVGTLFGLFYRRRRTA